MIEKRARMRQRIDTAAEWASKDPVLLAGEIGIDETNGAEKIGDGVTAWSSLRYSRGGARKTITALDTPYSVQPEDRVLLVDASGGAVVVQMPSAAASTAREIRCKKIDTSSNAAQYTPAVDETVEGESGSYDSTIPGEFMKFEPDGVDAWHRVG